MSYRLVSPFRRIPRVESPSTSVLPPSAFLAFPTHFDVEPGLISDKGQTLKKAAPRVEGCAKKVTYIRGLSASTQASYIRGSSVAMRVRYIRGSSVATQASFIRGLSLSGH